MIWKQYQFLVFNENRLYASQWQVSQILLVHSRIVKFDFDFNTDVLLLVILASWFSVLLNSVVY